MEVAVEDSSAAGDRVPHVGEPGLDTGGFVAEWERKDWGLDSNRQPIAVLGGLELHLGERFSLGLGFDGADRLSIHEEEVISPAMRRLEDELAYRDTAPSDQVHLLAPWTTQPNS